MYGRFLSQFLAHPGAIGAIAPSSRCLARCMMEWIDWQQARSIVEYGPGTGVFTEAVLESKHPDARFFAIELNCEFAQLLRERFPTLSVYEDSVANVRQLCEREGIDEVDAIISGLPWAAFSAELQTQLLEATMGVLRSGGQFTTFAYLQGLMLPAGRRFRQRLQENFREVQVSRVVWRNMPPAVVYRCRR